MKENNYDEREEGERRILTKSITERMKRKMKERRGERTLIKEEDT